MRKLGLLVLTLALIGVSAFLLGCAPLALVSAAPVQPVTASIAQVNPASAVVQPNAPKLSVATRKVLDEGNKQMRAKDYEAALASYQTVVQAQPEVADGYLALGRAYGAMKNYDQAIAVYESGVTTLPNNVDMRIALGNTYNARGFHIDPRCGSPHSGIGASPGTKDDKFLREQWIAKADSNYQSALGAFGGALALSPNNVAAHDGIAYAHFRQGNYDIAAAWAGRAVQLAPKDSHRYVAVANNYRRMRDYETALTWYDQAIARNVKDYGAIKYLWETYQALKDWDRAIARLTQIVQADPKNTEASLRLGQAYAAKGDLTSALTWFENTLTLNPELGEAWKYAAPVYKKLGNTEKFQLAVRNAEWYKHK